MLPIGDRAEYQMYYGRLRPTLLIENNIENQKYSSRLSKSILIGSLLEYFRLPCDILLETFGML